jgi:PTH1 family peptidyl-tRNA hydrolase
MYNKMDMSSSNYILTLLGNPGNDYAANRHNAGRLLAENFSFSISWQHKFKGLFSLLPSSNFKADLFITETEPTGTAKKLSNVYLLEPETYMNLSGESVKAAAAFYKIPSENIIVVHDELELPLGQAAFKFGGGLGGHNGLRSIKASLGTADFWRLRIGIGRPVEKNADIAGWVLSDFSMQEKPILQKVLKECAAAVEKAVVCGPESLLPEWNKKKIAA